MKIDEIIRQYIQKQKCFTWIGEGVQTEFITQEIKNEKTQNKKHTL